MPTMTKPEKQTSPEMNGSRPSQPPAERPSASSAAMRCFRQYAKECPETVTLWALGIGFVIGWKLKPW